MAAALYFPLTTRNYHNSRVRAILDTWGKDILERLFFFSDSLGFTERIVDLGVPSDYGSASLKLLSGLQWINQNIHVPFDWYVFCDDDTFIFTHRLERALSTKDCSEAHCYGFHCKHYPPLPDLAYPSGGAGFAIGHGAFKRIIPALDGCQLYPYSDVTIGACMQSAGITLQNMHGFYPNTPEFMAPRVEPDLRHNLIRDALTFHYISPERMYDLYSSGRA